MSLPNLKQIKQLTPGLIYASVLAAVAYVVNIYVPLISALLIAILLGIVVRNTGLIPKIADIGLKFSSKTVLRAGVVLLGLRLSIPAVIDLGWQALVVIFLSVGVTYPVTLLIGRALGVAHSTRVLVATGTSICGAAAVAGVSAVVRQDPQNDDDVEEAATGAVAGVTLFGTISLLVIPLLAHALGMGAHLTGVWTGSSIHEVGQVAAAADIGASHFSGAAAAQLINEATLTKLGRVVLLAPLVAIVGFFETRRQNKFHQAQVMSAEVQAVISGQAVDHGPANKRAPLVPLFVVGFLLMVLARSVLEGVIPAGFFAWSQVLATLLLTVAMAAMGAAVNLRQLISSGGKSLLLALCATLVITTVSFGSVALLIGW